MDRALAENQRALLVQIARCIHIKQVLHSVEPNPSQNFWRLLYGGMLDLPVLDWCKVFGSNSEPTHWTGIVTDVEEFRTGMLEYLEIDESKWTDYWNGMKSYRDELVAHHEAGTEVGTYPSLDIALRSCYFFHSYLSDALYHPAIVPADQRLDSYCTEFRSLATDIAQAALEATADIEESVN